MKKIFKSKGFTLVEMVIAMALTAILMGAVMMLFTPVNNIIKSLQGDVNINITTDTISQYLFDRMANSTNFDISLNALDADGKMDPAASENTINNQLSDKFDPMLEKLYAIIIMDGKLYDLGSIENYEEYATKVEDYESYRLFDDRFYGDVHYKYSFYTVESPSASTAADKWYHVGITPYAIVERDDDGNAAVIGDPVISERATMFKLINLQFSNFDPSIGGVFYTTNPDSTVEAHPQDNGVVILYRIKDYTKVTSAPALTPEPTPATPAAPDTP